MRWVWNLDERPALPPGRPEVEIRVLPVRGVKVAAGIMAQTWRGYVAPEEAGVFLRTAQAQGRLYPFVAYINGHPVGSAVVVGRGRSAQLYGGVHVLPGHRRSGVGSAILRAVLRHLGSLGLSRLSVSREISDPPTSDDLAAQALYDRAGGLRRGPVVDVVYSPQCPWCVQWLEDFAVEAGGREVEFQTHDLYEEAYEGRAWRLIEASGLARRGDRGPVLLENIFTRVFVDEELVGSDVPLPPGRLAASLEAALGDDTARLVRGLSADRPPRNGTSRNGSPGSGSPGVGAPAAVPYPRVRPSVSAYPGSLAGLSLIPLRAADPSGALAMCLERHPSGSAPRGGHGDRGSEIKRRWLASLDLPGGFYGVAAERDGRVAGLLEAYPRPVAARAGYVTGTWSPGAPDAEGAVATLTCLEVAAGEARQPVMEFLLEGLLRELKENAPGVEFIEAVGVYGNLAGFNPYWLFDKYGFARREERAPGKTVIMSREPG